MGENKSLVETIVKSKAFVCFLVLWGVLFLFQAMSDIAYYVDYFAASSVSETTAESITWIISDIAAIGAAISLWAVSAKILQTKS